MITFIFALKALADTRTGFNQQPNRVANKNVTHCSRFLVLIFQMQSNQSEIPIQEQSCYILRCRTQPLTSCAQRAITFTLHPIIFKLISLATNHFSGHVYSQYVLLSANNPVEFNPFDMQSTWFPTKIVSSPQLMLGYKNYVVHKDCQQSTSFTAIVAVC